jgi:two-component system sensor histidine kinase MtrB
MAMVIQNALFESRKTQALEDALRAVDSAQAILDSAEIGDDPAALSELWDSIQKDLARNSTAEGITGSRIETESGADVATVRLNCFTAGLRMTHVSPAQLNRFV